MNSDSEFMLRSSQCKWTDAHVTTLDVHDWSFLTECLKPWRHRHGRTCAAWVVFVPIYFVRTRDESVSLPLTLNVLGRPLLLNSKEELSLVSKHWAQVCYTATIPCPFACERRGNRSRSIALNAPISTPSQLLLGIQTRGSSRPWRTLVTSWSVGISGHGHIFG
jgi:hypothetical protein